MKLRLVHLRRMPGIEPPFQVGDVANGINLIHGPNGSGKSSTRRAVRLLLFPNPADRADDTRFIEVEAEFDDGGETLRADRTLGEIRWTRGGEPSEPPPLPDPHLADCFAIGARELLQVAGGSDQELARQIHRQMSGGYDLQSVREKLFALQVRRGGAEARTVESARRSISRLENEQRDLDRMERELGDLELQRTRAEDARRQVEALNHAVELAKTRSRLREVALGLSAFPPGIDKVRLGDYEELVRLQGELGSTITDIESCKGRVAARRREIEEASLPAGPISLEEVDAHIVRARKLESIEAGIAELEQMVAELELRRSEARKDLGAANSSKGILELSPKLLGDLDGFASQAEELRARKAVLREERARIEEGDASYDRERLVDARSRILEWLAASGKGLRADPTRARGSARRPLIFPVALTLVAAGSALAFLRSPWWLMLTVVGAAGLAWYVAIVRARAEAERYAEERADAARRSFEDLGVEGPREWSREAANARLREIDGELRRAERAAEDARLLRDLDARESLLREEESAFEAKRVVMRDSLGVAPEADDLSLRVLSSRLLTLRELEVNLEAAIEKLGAERDRLTSMLEKLRGFLEGHGACATEDGAAVAAALADLKRRNDAAHAAARSQRNAEEELARLEGGLEEKRKRLAVFFEERALGAGDEEGLRERLSQIDAFQEIGSERLDLERRVTSLQAQLGDREDLLDVAEDEVASKLEKARGIADELDLIRDGIARRGAELEHARSDFRLEEAMARLDRATEELEARRDEALRKVAGGFLLNEVVGAHEREARPEVLTRASDYFKTFTSHRYDLGVVEADEHGTPRFFALDLARDERRGLAKLSDGERMQLLLSVRLAFAEQAERLAGGQRVTVPLFLDEAMSLADPSRFEAIAKALITLATAEANGGAPARQILYMSANPDDIRRWRHIAERCGAEPPHVIDLAKIRGLERAPADPFLLETTPPKPTPEPGGRSANEYARELQVPLPGAFSPGSSLHLFHLLRDDLELLHQVLVAGIETVGQWKSLAASAAVAAVVSDLAERHRINARVEAALATVDAWSVGRGHPVTARDLEASGAVSEAFLGRVVALLEDCEGDARRLIEMLRDSESRPKRWRDKATENLEAYLEEEGLLDRRDRLSLHTANLWAIERTRDHVRVGATTVEEIRNLSHHLWSLLERS